MSHRVRVALFILSLTFAPAVAQTAAPSFVPFVLPWNDASPSVTNVSDLLSKPAGKLGFVRAREGRLFAGKGRIRFFGVNITTSACFPSHEQAEQVAARLAKFGVNCVRFHHMDASWTDGLIFTPDRLRLDAGQLDRLDYFIAQLKKNGIYSDLNLHVSREYPGFEKWEGMPSFFKGVDLFYSPMVRMQKDYARDLLTHRNPYTGARYADEPAVAFVEINNENGLISTWNNGSLDNMPDRYRVELRRQWNAWLRARYKDDAAMRKAWGMVTRPLGAEALRGGDFSQGMGGWGVEQHGDALVSSEIVGGDRPTLRLDVRKVDSEPWHVQLSHAGIGFKEGEPYTLTFRARADAQRRVSVAMGQAHAPWAILASATADLGSEWKEYTFVLCPTASEANGRLVISEIGARVGVVELADISLRPGAVYKAAECERLGSAEIVRRSEFPARTLGTQKDWIRFLWETESGYWMGMSRFLKGELKVKSLVIGSAVGFSPIPIQAKLDVVDNHAYWMHPYFPRKEWDSVDWIVRNVSMAGTADGGTIRGLSTARVQGKPYIVTEYNSPAPNTHNSEAFILLAAYASFQDWDGIFAFSYASSRENWDAQRIVDFFDIDQHPTQMATFSTAAAIFLRGDVASPARRVLTPAPSGAFVDKVRRYGPWANAEHFGLNAMAPFASPVALDLTGKAAAPSISPVLPIRSEGGALSWGDSAVTIDTPRTKGVVGPVTGKGVILGGVKIEPGPNSQGWACITLTAMTAKGLMSPGSSLLTATGAAQNTGMQWSNERRESVGANWGGPPSLVEVIPAAITLPIPADRVAVWALDERGRRSVSVPVTGGADMSTCNIGPEYRTIWYEVVVR